MSSLDISGFLVDNPRREHRLDLKRLGSYPHVTVILLQRCVRQKRVDLLDTQSDESSPSGFNSSRARPIGVAQEPAPPGIVLREPTAQYEMFST